MGLLIDEESPVVWRGPMIMKTIRQFAHNVVWGELDFLLIDLPPGTGDAQLSLAQILPLDDCPGCHHSRESRSRCGQARS